MLTERIIRDAKPTGKTRTIWDAKTPGLGLQITRGGTMNFVIRYRTEDGRKRQSILARVGQLSLAQARERAGDELANIRAGNPDPLQRRENRQALPTVAEGVERFLAHYVPRRVEDGRMAKRTGTEYARQCRAYLLPVIGEMRIEDVRRADIESMVADLRPVVRNRVLSLASRLFNLFEQWELRPQHSNPARMVERNREQPRDRTLSPAELAALAAALRELEELYPAAVAAIRVAAVTGLRIGEVTAMRWENVDFEKGRLLIPESKTGRRWHDLPSAALATLAGLPRINGNPFAFTNGRTAIGYRYARTAFAEAVAAAGIPDVRLHDLRRTVMTNAAAAGVGTHVLRDLLGHKSTAMADRYIRAVGNPVRDAREEVGASIAAMMDGESGEVVSGEVVALSTGRKN